MLKERSKQIKVNQETYGLLFAELMQNPSTCHDLIEVTGLNITTMYGLMRILRRHRVVYVSAWETDTIGRECVPVFTLGKGKDVKRRTKDRATIAREYRARKKSQALIAGFCAANGDAFEVAA